MRSIIWFRISVQFDIKVPNLNVKMNFFPLNISPGKKPCYGSRFIIKCYPYCADHMLVVGKFSIRIILCT